jgi:hypothetical protein
LRVGNVSEGNDASAFEGGGDNENVVEEEGGEVTGEYGELDENGMEKDNEVGIGEIVPEPDPFERNRGGLRYVVVS